MSSAAWLSDAARRVMALSAPGQWMPDPVPGAVNLAAGYPFPAALPREALTAAFLALSQAEGEAPFQYAGSPASQWLWQYWHDRMEQDGILRASDGLLLTVGSIQALDLALRVSLRPGEAVMVQGPTYMEALEIIGQYTHAVTTIPTGESGVNLDRMEEVLEAWPAATPRPRLFYCGVSFQNPTGLTLSTPARLRLLQLAERFQFLIIEDGAYDALSFDAPLPTLKALGDGDRVLYLGSLSKTVAPGLRVGWAVGPAAMIAAMDRYKKDLAHPVAHGIAAYYLRQGTYPAHLQRIREGYRRRAAIMLSQLERTMPGGVQWTTPSGGYFVWMMYPPDVPAAALVEAARTRGVLFIDGRHCYRYGQAPPHPGLRLSYSHADVGDLELGIERLAEAIKDVRRHPPED